MDMLGIHVFAGQTAYGVVVSGGSGGRSVASVCTRTQAVGALSSRLAVVRAAQLVTRTLTVCAQVGCHNTASSRVHGLPFCPGHAGFAAVRGLVPQPAPAEEVAA